MVITCIKKTSLEGLEGKHDINSVTTLEMSANLHAVYVFVIAFPRR